MKKALMALVGILLMIVGIAGLILPILPGWPILFFGLSLIAPKLAERLKKYLFRKLFKTVFKAPEGLRTYQQKL